MRLIRLLMKLGLDYEAVNRQHLDDDFSLQLIFCISWEHRMFLGSMPTIEEIQMKLMETASNNKKTESGEDA